MKGLDIFINFIIRGWFLIFAIILVVGSIYLFVSKIVPVARREVEKIKFIASEYRAVKKLKKLDSKTKLELKILEKDIKKELDLLGKIGSHRSLHSDERYLRDKLEKYYNMLKKL